MDEKQLREGLEAICMLLLNYGGTDTCRAAPHARLEAAKNGAQQIINFLDFPEEMLKRVGTEKLFLPLVEE